MVWSEPVTSGVPWEAKSEMEISMQDVYWEGSWDQQLWKTRERIWQREKLGCGVVSVKISVDLQEALERRLSFRIAPWWVRGFGTTVSHWICTAWCEKGLSGQNIPKEDRQPNGYRNQFFSPEGGYGLAGPSIHYGSLLRLHYRQTPCELQDESYPKDWCYPHRFLYLVTFTSSLLEKRAGPYSIEQSFDQPKGFKGEELLIGL